jgi:hypothetical protein
MKNVKQDLIDEAFRVLGLENSDIHPLIYLRKVPGAP